MGTSSLIEPAARPWDRPLDYVSGWRLGAASASPLNPSPSYYGLVIERRGLGGRLSKSRLLRGGREDLRERPTTVAVVAGSAPNPFIRACVSLSRGRESHQDFPGLDADRERPRQRNGMMLAVRRSLYGEEVFVLGGTGPQSARGF